MPRLRRSLLSLLVAGGLALGLAACDDTVDGIQEDTVDNINEVDEELDTEGQ